MTDNDIIKALVKCSNLSNGCFGCPLYSSAWDEYGKSVAKCEGELIDYALDLINRQKAEIADLEEKKKICAEVIARQDKEIENLSKTVDNYESCLRCVEVIRVNAINEFAERLKRRHLLLRPCFGIVRCCLSETDIDHLVKEMTEDTK